jgi:hypothetical protein
MIFAWHSTTGLVKDDCVNTSFYMKGNGDVALTTADQQYITDQWATMLINSLSATLNGHTTAKWYNMNDPEPRVPINTLTSASDIFTRATDSLPREVSLCLTWTADAASGVRASRLRGRSYIPPMGLANANSATGRPLDAGITTFSGRAHTFLANLYARDTSNRIRMVVYSRGLGSRKPDGTYRPNWDPFVSPVTGGWVDNEWDTQRSRGLEETAKTLFTLT